MGKNRGSLSVVGYILALFLVVGGLTVWGLYREANSSQNTTIEQLPVNNEPVSKIDDKDKLTIDHNQDNTAKDYPKPTAPTGLKATPAESGYNLTWEASVSINSIAKYQVFYQGNLIAEPTNTTYQHNLPPPPPGCQPMALSYYVKAVDNDGSFSIPSNSVTVQFGAC